MLLYTSATVTANLPNAVPHQGCRHSNQFQLFTGKFLPISDSSSAKFSIYVGVTATQTFARMLPLIEWYLSAPFFHLRRSITLEVVTKFSVNSISPFGNIFAFQYSTPVCLLLKIRLLPITDPIPEFIKMDNDNSNESVGKNLLGREDEEHKFATSVIRVTNKAWI